MTHGMTSRMTASIDASINASINAKTTSSTTVEPTPRTRLLTEVDCHEIANRLARFAKGGGYTTTTIVSTWTGNVRWARNQVSTSGEVRENHVVVNRNLRGATNTYVHVNDVSDASLVAAARRAERLAALEIERPEYDLVLRYQPEPYPTPSLFSEATYNLDAAQRAAAAQTLVQSAKEAGMLSAGYLEVSAHSMAFISSTGYARYFQYTSAQYSVTVRDPQGTGSGWAGVDWHDWHKIDGARISAVALDKCLQSRSPVQVEPGRYTTILEPQAVCDLLGGLMFDISGSTPFEEGALARAGNEGGEGPFNKIPGSGGQQGVSLLGERVVDARITLRTDPMDPELGFPPFPGLQNMFDTFSPLVSVYHPVTWIERGILKTLAANRTTMMSLYGRPQGVLNSGAFRIDVDGPQTSMEEMIATTKRGVLVTRFSGLTQLDFKSQLYRGYTRDGVWFIENGKISKPAKNFSVTESPLFALNNVEQLGTPQRVFHPTQKYAWWTIPQPVIVPPLKVRDFSFTALADAV
jgi:predicted Zn-dependent protease